MTRNCWSISTKIRDFLTPKLISISRDHLSLDQAKLFVNIGEGIRYRISSVAVSGLMGKEEEKVLSLVRGLRPGDYFKHSVSEAVKQDIKSYFANNGYPYAQELTRCSKNDRDSTSPSISPSVKGRSGGVRQSGG